MRAIEPEVIYSKLHHLSPQHRQEVSDFVEFLISRQKKKKAVSRKERLLAVTTWSQDDIGTLEKVAEEVNQWTIPES